MKFKAYMTNYIPEEERIKILIRVYDSDIPSQWKELDENNVEVTKVRDEYPITIYVPYGQGVEFIKDRIKEALEKFKNNRNSLDVVENMKLSNEQIE